MEKFIQKRQDIELVEKLLETDGQQSRFQILANVREEGEIDDQSNETYELEEESFSNSNTLPPVFTNKGKPKNLWKPVLNKKTSSKQL